MISADLLKILSAFTEAHLTKGLKRPLFKFLYKHRQKHSQTTSGLLINNKDCRFYKQQHEAQLHEQKQSIPLVQPRAKEVVQLSHCMVGFAGKTKKIIQDKAAPTILDFQPQSDYCSLSHSTHSRYYIGVKSSSKA